MNPSQANATELAGLIRPLVHSDGITPTALPAVSLFCLHGHHERAPLLYEPSLIVIAQGRKIGYLGDREIHYHPGQYLVQTLPLPFECETRASADAPLLGLSVRIEPALLSELVAAMGDTTHPHANRDPVPMDSVAMTEGISTAVRRLLRTVHDDAEAQAMGDARVREVIFEALRGKQGPALRALVLNRGTYSRIVQVLSRLHAHYSDDFTVEDLARQANMSPSSFHQRFKEITHRSPIQYMKHLRLIKAQLLLSQNELNINQTATSVGYRSQSQFSRDYKRYFGVSPLQHRQQYQTMSGDRA